MQCNENLLKGNKDFNKTSPVDGNFSTSRYPNRKDSPIIPLASVIRKIGDSRIVWFQSSNRWMEFKEPAWFVYELFRAGESPDHIACQVAERYAATGKEKEKHGGTRGEKEKFNITEGGSTKCGDSGGGSKKFGSSGEKKEQVDDSKVGGKKYGDSGEEAAKYESARHEAEIFCREIIEEIRLASGGLNSGDRFSDGGKQPSGLRPVKRGVSGNLVSPDSEEPPTELRSVKKETSGVNEPIFKTKYYSINGKNISIGYGSPAAEFFIHRPLAYLEVKPFQSSKGPSVKSEPEKTTDAELGNRVYMNPKINPELLHDNRILKLEISASEMKKDVPTQVKHRIYTAICNHIHDLNEEDWLSYIHASAVTNGKEALLLSSSSGSGKSTLAALLQLPPENFGIETQAKLPHNQTPKARLYFMSDDFLPVAAGNLHAYPFPSAITVKSGSFDVIAPWYDPSEDADSTYPVKGEKQVRYLRPVLPPDYPFGERPVKGVVFIKYVSGRGLRLKELDTITALREFHKEAWVSHNPDNAGKFIDWFMGLRYWRLEYSDNRRAIETVHQLFNQSLI